MGEDTNIAWCDHTWNPWLGCERKAGHPGCVNCYAQDYFRHWKITGKRRKTAEAYWRQPLKWDKQAEEEGVQRSVFPSMCDPFEDWDGPIVNAKGERLACYPDSRAPGFTRWPPQCIPAPDGLPARAHGLQWLTMDDVRRDLFQLIDQTPNLTWILATKRPENIRRMWSMVRPPELPDIDPGEWFRPNVQLLYSASDQASLESGIGHLLRCKDLSPVLGLSLEPLIGPIDLHFGDDMNGDEDSGVGCVPCDAGGTMHQHYIGESCNRGIDWIIVGGESGPNARPCQIEHVDDILRQCEEAGVWCFVKQMGSNAVTSNVNLFDYPRSLYPIDGRDGWKPWGEFAAGARIPFAHPKGGDPAEWPEPMRVQQYPDVKP